MLLQDIYSIKCTDSSQSYIRKAHLNCFEYSVLRFAFMCKICKYKYEVLSHVCCNGNKLIEFKIYLRVCLFHCAFTTLCSGCFYSVGLSEHGSLRVLKFTVASFFFIKVDFKKHLTKIYKKNIYKWYLHWLNVNQNMQQHFLVVSLNTRSKMFCTFYVLSDKHSI